MNNRKFLIIDDHQMIRESLTVLLRKLYPRCQVTEVADEAAAVALLKGTRFQLVILDVNLPGSDALGLMEYLHAAFPACPVIIFSMHLERVYEQQFLKAGASGYVSKGTDAGELQKAIDLVLRGRRYQSSDQWLVSSDPTGKDPLHKPFERLSAREFQVALLLLDGQTVTQVSTRLSLHPSTVGTHKAHIFGKVGAKNMAEFFRIAHVQQVGG